MLRPGLVSVSFRKLSVEDIICLATRAGLSSIEWGGDVHVPHGNARRAVEVARRTRDAGLSVSSYGSYYRAAAKNGDNPDFAAVLDCAAALAAPTIRVWAGAHRSSEADSCYRRAVADDLLRIADLAAASGATISLEYHNGTLTDTDSSAQKLLAEVPHPGLRAYWQKPLRQIPAQALSALTALRPRLSNLHVFQWVNRSADDEQRPLAEGETEWRMYLAAVADLPGERHALLEFFRGDSPDQMLQDSATVIRWLRETAS